MWLEVVVASLATWRLASLVLFENGPFQMFDRLRRAVGVYNEGEVTGLAELFSCIWCLSVWAGIAITFIVVLPGFPWIVLPFALSSAAIIFDKLLRG